MKIVRACIIAAAVALMLTSAFLHSSIISPSIYHDGTVLVPQRASISLNGTVIADEGELPMMVTRAVRMVATSSSGRATTSW